jgi:hypothetical protein
VAIWSLLFVNKYTPLGTDHFFGMVLVDYIGIFFFTFPNTVNFIKKISKSTIIIDGPSCLNIRADYFFLYLVFNIMSNETHTR